MDQAIARIIGIQKEIQRGDAIEEFLTSMTKEDETDQK